ncbi:MAG: zinc-dependent metalloprotease, partial [Actinomycetota bacterium]|nr:zinc-dependent metalloprotease [Actinomycetota bacterium]
WWAVGDSGGIAARDALWAHPDLLPTAEDLDNPAGFLARTSSGGDQPSADVDWDAGLRDLDKDLDGTLDDDATGGPEGPVTS